MEIQDIHKTIVTLTSLYSDLNEFWKTDKCIVDTFQVLRQEKYKGFYEILNQSNIEELTLSIISNSLNKNVLIRLQSLIEQNISIYRQRQSQFDGLDFYALYELDEHNQFDNKLALLLKDKEDIQNFEYPTEQEKTMLLKENQQEINQLRAEKSDYIRTSIWITVNYYSKIHELSQSFLSIINSYFPDEEKSLPQTENNSINPTPEYPEIEPNMIFRTNMYEKFLPLEQQLIRDKYLNNNLHWIAVHDNGKPDIKSLVTFLTALLDNRYFLPNKDPKIKTFFEYRYHIIIGQNFEPKRRKPLLNEYKAVFYDYPF
jgi:hypothetical protein